MTIEEITLAAAQNKPLEGLHLLDQVLYNRLNLVYTMYRHHFIGVKEGQELKQKFIEDYENEIERIKSDGK